MKLWKLSYCVEAHGVIKRKQQIAKGLIWELLSIDQKTWNQQLVVKVEGIACLKFWAGLGKECSCLLSVFWSVFLGQDQPRLRTVVVIRLGAHSSRCGACWFEWQVLQSSFLKDQDWKGWWHQSLLASSQSGASPTCFVGPYLMPLWTDHMQQAICMLLLFVCLHFRKP